MVYKLMAEYEREGTLAYKPKKVGRPSQKINRNFIGKVISLRKETDYGSQKLHFALVNVGLMLPKDKFKKFWMKTGSLNHAKKEEGSANMFASNGQLAITCGILIGANTTINGIYPL